MMNQKQYELPKQYLALEALVTENKLYTDRVYSELSLKSDRNFSDNYSGRCIFKQLLQKEATTPPLTKEKFEWLCQNLDWFKATCNINCVDDVVKHSDQHIAGSIYDPVFTYKVHSVTSKGLYEIRKETVCYNDGTDVINQSNSYEAENTYTPSGDWIGDVKMAKLLCEKYGIAPEKSNPQHCICSIGFSERDRKWYGWSHRALAGFKIGDRNRKGHICEHNLPIDFECKTLEDCKRMAIAFADAVS